jgi:hypothetical protein
VDSAQRDAQDLVAQPVILRLATDDDAAALETLDVGNDPSPWLDEVREMLSGLLAWKDDVSQAHLGRRVVVAEEAGAVIAVSADECIEDEQGRIRQDGRYLMVVAVRAEVQRSGTARLLTESLFALMQAEGTRSLNQTRGCGHD